MNQDTFSDFLPFQKSLDSQHPDLGIFFRSMRIQPVLRICPDPVPALPGGTSVDVFLQDPRVLPLLPCQAS